MIGNLLVAFAAFLLAAWLSPVLTDTFLVSAAGSVAAAGAAIFPENLADLSLSGWFVLLLWTVILWVILRYIGVPFGFIRPRAERLSDTKPMRYFQGAFGEGLIFFACMFAGLMIAALISPIIAEENKAEIIEGLDQQIAELDKEYGEYINSYRYAGIKSKVIGLLQKSRD